MGKFGSLTAALLVTLCYLLFSTFFSNSVYASPSVSSSRITYQRSPDDHTNEIGSVMGCNGITVDHYSWGTEVYLPPCAVSLIEIGFALSEAIPDVGEVISGLGIPIEAAAALSCDGSVYVDVVFPISAINNLMPIAPPPPIIDLPHVFERPAGDVRPNCKK